MDPLKVRKSDIVNWENPLIRQILADQLDHNLHVSETINRIAKLTGARPSVNIVTQRVRRYREKRDKAMKMGIYSCPKYTPVSHSNLNNQPSSNLLPIRLGVVKANSGVNSDLFRDQLPEQHDKQKTTTVNQIHNSSGTETSLSASVSHTNDPTLTLPPTEIQSKHSFMQLSPPSDKTELSNGFEYAIPGISTLVKLSEPAIPTVSPATPNVPAPAATNNNASSNNGKLARAQYLLQVRKAAMCCLDKVNFLHTIGENTVGFNNRIGFTYAEKAAIDDLYSVLRPLARFHEPQFTLETTNAIIKCLNHMKQEMDLSDSPLVDLTGYRLDQFKSILAILEKKLVTIVEISYDNTGSMNTVAINIANCIQTIWVLVNELRPKK